MNMKNLDFESWEKEHKDINNNLAVPLYRKFCKEYELNFHFADEKNIINHDIPFEILHSEMPLHGKALSLFNFVNKPYHPFREGLVSFAYTSWDDFNYDYLGLGEIAQEMENKDIAISKLKNESKFYGAIVLILSLLLTGMIVIKFTDLDIIVYIALIINVVLLIMIPNFIYLRRRKMEQQKFDKKLSELKLEFQDISIREGRDKTKEDKKSKLSEIDKIIANPNIPDVVKQEFIKRKGPRSD